ncbi:MAG TPA: DUF58 domain-containing protein [Steroidobacteraceae bacterium]|jgi:uncharacterized protein (DUF58 family)|nr:DUF58 domain-containing protein [Steroidobacteraceae bacterium]
MDSSKPSRFRFDARGRLAARAQRWAQARQGDDSPPLTLLQRRIYILPTKAGVSTSVLLFAMLLAGMNYGNSLALFLCFTLSGVALVSMHECHRSLAGLKLLRAHVENSFAGQVGELQLYFENVDTRLRDSLSVKCSPCDEVAFRVQPGEIKPVTVNFLARTRGRQRIDRLRLSTTAPMGLFRAWAWIHLPLEAIIYPAATGNRALPPRQGEPRLGRQLTHNTGEEEWAWLRNYQNSDPPRSVAWKAYARGAPLMVAHYDSPAGMQRTLRFSAVPGNSVEQKLSQLTRWVLECERLGEDYALELPEATQASGHGVAHRRACLESLAQYGL